MSFEDFQIIENEVIDNSIIKRDFINVCHQQGAQLNDPDQNIEFIFGGINNYHQIGNSYLQFEITIRNPAANFADDTPIRIVKNGSAHCFKEAVVLTTGGMEIENTIYLGQVSTIMRSLTSKEGDLLSQFDNFNEEIGADENAASNIIRSTSLYKMLINNRIEANRG